MSKVQYPIAGEFIDAEAFINAQRKSVNGFSDNNFETIVQAHPGDANYGNAIVGIYESGLCNAQVLCPTTYVTAFDYGTNHCFLGVNQEVWVYQRTMTDSGDGLTWYVNQKNWIDGTGDYTIKVYVNTVLQVTGYTVDADNGTVTFTSDQSGNSVKITGYYLETNISYMKDIDLDTIKNCITGTGSNYSLPILNPRFDNWTSSTQPTSWTVSGTCNQTASLLGNNSGYVPRLTATVGVTKISQTLSLGSSVNSVVCCAVARCTNTMKLRVSVDSGLTWTSLIYTATALSANKWIFLGVQSYVNSTTEPIIEFFPQDTGSTGTADVEFIGAFYGGLS